MEKITGEREKRTVLLICLFLSLPFATLHLMLQNMQHRTDDLLRYKFLTAEDVGENTIFLALGISTSSVVLPLPS